MLQGGGKEGAVQKARSSGLRSWRELDLPCEHERELRVYMTGCCCRIDASSLISSQSTAVSAHILEGSLRDLRILGNFLRAQCANFESLKILVSGLGARAHLFVTTRLVV